MEFLEKNPRWWTDAAGADDETDFWPRGWGRPAGAEGAAMQARTITLDTVARMTRYCCLLLFCLTMSSSVDAQTDPRLVANPDEGEWTLFVIADTQHYSQDLAKAPIANMHAAFDWLVATRDQLNIKFVQGLGDITESWNNTTEWNRSSGAWNKLYGEIPFVVNRGNHDSPVTINAYFPVSNFSGESWWGGSFEGIQNTYQLFTFGQEDYLFVNVEPHDQYSTGNPAALQWTNDVIAAHPDRKVILATHDIWATTTIKDEVLVNHANLVMSNAGHTAREQHYLTTGPGGAGVSQNFITDYQFDNPEVMLMRYYVFKPLEDRVYYYTYSPITDTFEEDANSEGYFELVQASVPSTEVRIDSFTANPSTIAQGESSTLSWETLNTTSVTLNGQTVNAQGSETVTPGTTGTHTYTLTVQGEGGPKTGSVTVTVLDPATLHMKMNCGAASGDVQGWESDDAYVASGDDHTFDGTADTSGVTDPAPDAVYKTVRHGYFSSGSFTYDIPTVPDGTYVVRLHFNDGVGGDRQMDFTIEGVKVLDGFNIVNEAGGVDKALVKEFTVNVTGGDGVQILCEQDTGNDVFVSGIEIIGAGGGDPITDTDGDGMDDDWETTHFGDLSHDGTADTDGDGQTDLEEFQVGTDPTTGGGGPVGGGSTTDQGCSPGTSYGGLAGLVLLAMVLAVLGRRRRAVWTTS